MCQGGGVELVKAHQPNNQLVPKNFLLHFFWIFFLLVLLTP